MKKPIESFRQYDNDCFGMYQCQQFITVPIQCADCQSRCNTVRPLERQRRKISGIRTKADVWAKLGGVGAVIARKDTPGMKILFGEFTLFNPLDTCRIIKEEYGEKKKNFLAPMDEFIYGCECLLIGPTTRKREIWFNFWYLFNLERTAI